ncbi:MAG TPA: undecaprenyl-diphosphatase UppP [Candidatus Omnitrophota bacterium]|nr:undecaprenyl-diphosphatase UppP [Candidatus Omnitrophota bacterium]
MTIAHAVILGIIQGIAEFLPISSSAHLVFVPWILNWAPHTLTFDVALHIGTLIALLAFFWKEWWGIIRSRLLWFILVGCIPGAVAGFLGEKYFEETFRGPVTIAVFMIGLGLLLWAAEVYSSKKRDIDSLNWVDSIVIGISQAFALMPGVSRAGITMTSGLFMGLTREAAARFSFLLSAPIIAGAGLYKGYGLLKHGGLPSDERLPFLVGMLTAAIVGFFAIKYLLQYLQKNSFYLFVWYRIIVGAGLIILFLMRAR